MTATQEIEIGGTRGEGWHQVDLPVDAGGNGLLYIMARSSNEGAYGLPAAKVMVLR